MIVFAALLPMVLVSAFLGVSTLENTQNLASSRLIANAKAIAERERDPFIIAQHLLMTVAANRDVEDMGVGCNDGLIAGLRDYKPIVNFARTDASGAVRCSVLPFKEGATLADADWWQRGIKRPEMTISQPVVGNIFQRKVLILMLPIRTAAGVQNGALSAGIDIGYLEDTVARAPESRSSIISIVTSDGQSVASNSAFNFPFKEHGRPNDVQLIRAPDGEVWMYSVAKLYGSDLHVVYAERRSKLMAGAISQIRTSIILPLISIFLATLAIWFGTHRLVVRWLRDLGRIADSFARGDFSGDRTRFENAPAEIAELSADLHSMAEVIDNRSRDLTSALEAKTDLTREVHHRVKNNLQIITSLLTLQAGRMDDELAREVLGQTRARISALALIHRLLYQHDTEDERGRVALENLMSELCVQLRTANRNKSGVDLQCDASAHSIEIDQAVPLALFAVEAVTNAFRHAFPDGRKGTIRLAFEHIGSDAVLTITDNGQGFFPDDTIEQMGLELMSAFASQLGGTLKIESDAESGSRVTLRFPVSCAVGA